MDYKLNYYKPNTIHLEELQQQNPHEDFNPYEIQELQLYNPIYSRFFEMNDSNYQSIALNHPYHIKDLHHVNSQEGNVEERKVFIKFSPLLDPYRYMIGKYDVSDPTIRVLPKLHCQSESLESHPKLVSPNNTSYVDCFFTFLSSVLKNNYNFENGIDFYGSYLGIQKKYKVALSDDMEYLDNSAFFNKNLGGLFHIEEKHRNTIMHARSTYDGSRKFRLRLCLEETGEEEVELPIVEIESESIEHHNGLTPLETDLDIEMVYENSPKNSETTYNSSLSSKSSSNSSSVINYSSDDDSIVIEEDVGDDMLDDLVKPFGKLLDSESESDSDSDSEESEEEEIYGFIDNFPIQMICMEQCDGTLDQLLENDKIDEDNGCSALFQVIMILLTYQKTYSFTHNDLHTNNIMYVKTDKPFLYYMFEGNVYKVPTYGKIFKLIDFGRGIYKYLGKTFCSDSFGPGGDASTQYNCEPFFNEKKPRLEPNYSFDLCRLGTSMFDFMMEIDDDVSDYDDLQKIVREWCLDDNGKNVLYLKNGRERYPSFKLYKMISRTVHNHTPEAQLQRPFFAKYKVNKETVDIKDVFSIDQFC